MDDRHVERFAEFVAHSRVHGVAPLRTIERDLKRAVGFVKDHARPIRLCALTTRRGGSPV